MSTFESSIPRRPASVTEVPLTPLQQRWWILHGNYPGGSSPIVSLARRLRGPLVVDLWARAVQTLVNRHESLRTLFVSTGPAPVQTVRAPDGFPVDRIDMSDLPEGDRVERARQLLKERRQVSVDLERGPVVTSDLVRLGADDHVWTMTIHHILADGASVDIIDRDLGALYRALVTGTDPGLPDLTVQYPDFALWWHESGPGEAEADDLRYWTRQLAGVPALELRTDHPRPPRKGDPAGEVRRAVAAALVNQIDELARSARSTRFMVLLAAAAALFGCYSGQPDFCIGVPTLGAGRSHPELVDVIGLFNNSIAVRVDLAGEPSFRQLLSRIRETVLDALDHQDAPFGQVVVALGAASDPSRAQVFQVMFELDDTATAGGLQLPGIVVEDFPLEIPKTLHDVMLFTWRVPDGLMTRLLYDTGLFHPDTAARMSSQYQALLQAAVTDPDRPVAELVTDLPG